MAVFTLASVRYVMPDNLNAPAGVHASGSGLPPLEVIVTPEVGAGSEIRVTLPMTTVAAGGELGQPVFSVRIRHQLPPQASSTRSNSDSPSLRRLYPPLEG